MFLVNEMAETPVMFKFKKRSLKIPPKVLIRVRERLHPNEVEASTDDVPFTIERTPEKVTVKDVPPQA